MSCAFREPVADGRKETPLELAERKSRLAWEKYNAAECSSIERVLWLVEARHWDGMVTVARLEAKVDDLHAAVLRTGF